MTPTLLDDARALGPELADLRRALHRVPEVGLDLPRTQALVLEALSGLDLEVTTGTALSSVTAVLRGGGSGARDRERPAVLLRADMDALPVLEDVDVPFRSTLDGAMHACGHDLHVAGLVGAARLLADRRAELPGDVVLMFQPGEEGRDGAGAMIAEGVLEASGRRPDAAWALHVFATLGPRGIVTSRPGPLMASSNELHVTVRGRGGHGSAPEAAADPVPAMCEMVLGLQSLVSRTVSPFSPAVLTVGHVAAGNRANVIPDTASFAATVRCFDEAVLARLEADTVRYCRGVAAGHGLEVDAVFRRQYPVTVNDAASVDLAERAVAAVLPPVAGGAGSPFARMAHPIAGAEDFSRVLAAVPGAMLFLGARPPGVDAAEAADNHSPRAVFDDAVLPEAATVLAELARTTLARA